MDAPTVDERIKAAALSPCQLLMIVICCLAYAADGVDFATLPLAAPALSKAWGIKPAMLGVALSASGVGLAIGSFILAPFADRIGRKAMTQVSLLVLAGVMFLSAATNSLAMLIGLRLCTGLALGTLVVTLNVSVSEFANRRYRTLAIGILHTGYTLGTMAGGWMGAHLLEPYGWRSLFIAAGGVSTGAFLLSLLLVESPSFLAQRQPAGALERLNAIFRRMRIEPLDALPPVADVGEGRVGVSALLIPAARRQTALLCLAGLIFTVTGTFIASWRPQILANSGLSLYWASMSVVIAGGIGLMAHLGIGLLARLLGEEALAIGTLFLMGVFLLLFGMVPYGSVFGFLTISALTTLFNLGAYTAIILVSISAFPASMRNAGMGFTNGFARVGAIVGPTLGGLIIAAGTSRQATFLIFGLLLLIPIAAVWAVRRIGPIPVVAD